MPDCARQYQILLDEVNRDLANPKTRERAMALKHVLIDLNRSIMDVWGMRADDPRSEIRYEELSFRARPLQMYLNENRGSLIFLKAAINDLVAARRRRDQAEVMINVLYPVASKNLTFDPPVAHPRAISAPPSGPSLAAS